jgi:hypothetical protein
MIKNLNWSMFQLTQEYLVKIGLKIVYYFQQHYDIIRLQFKRA